MSPKKDQPIEELEVRVGDTICIKYKIQDIDIAREGVVHSIKYNPHLARFVFFSKKGHPIVDPTINSTTIYLMNRPKPQLPDKVGSVIYAKSVRGKVCPPDTEPFKLMRLDSFSWASAGRINDSMIHYDSQIEDWREEK